VGTVVDTLAAQNGCDSVVTTITTLLPSFDKTINLTSCDPADVGTVVETLTAQNGCDSVVTTITTLLPSYDYTINDVTCNPLDSGIVVLNLTTADGCDSIVTIITELTDDYINFPDTAYVQCDPATQLGDYCLPIPWADINGYDIYIDGVVYFDQPFICDLDSSGGYDFSVLINSTPPTYGGTNHILRDWFINGVDVVTTNFNYTTFDQLVTYLNSKDPDGMWTLEDDDRIEGGFPFTSSNYGTLSIFSIEIGALANINYNSGVTSKGSLLEDFTPGCHWVVIENLNNPLCGPDSIYVCVECDNPEPSIDVEKHTNGQDADLPIGPVILVDLDGETVQWTYYVTNNGNIPLIDINVTDDKEGLVCTIPFLAPGQSDTCYLSGDAIRGMYSNLATATGQPIDQDGDPVGNPVMDQDPSHYTGVYINVEKIADKDTVCAGEEVTYNLIVRMLGGAPGVQIRNIKIVDNNLVDTLDVSSPYFVGNDVGGNGFIEFADNDNNGVNDEEFLFEYTLSINSNNTNVANDRGDIYFVDGQGNEFFIGTVGNTDTVKVVVDPSKCASIGDFVWNDTDGDGQQGLLEPGIAGVTVNLLDGNGVQVNTTTTNSNGFYEFTGLTPGNYIVEFIMPGGVTTTPVNQGNDATDSDANQATGQTGIITLANGEVNIQSMQDIFVFQMDQLLT
jgi:hypothetical protein